jgi:uncharacterized protein
VHRIVWIAVVALACGDKDKKAAPKPEPAATKPAPEPEKPKDPKHDGRSLGALTTGSGSAQVAGGRPADDVAPKPVLKPVAGECNWRLEDVALIEVCEYRCSIDDREACVLAAVRYMKGDGVKADPKKALELATRSCDLESAYGCTIAGGLNSADLPKLEAFAAKSKPLYERDCNEGNGPACLQVALLNVDAKAALPTYKKGFELLQKACDGGDGSQCAALARRTASGEYGLVKDVVAAADLRKKACEHDHATTCFELSTETTKDDKRDPLINKACTLGLRKACAKLAAELAGKNTTRMIDINKRACELGDADSCVRIGEDYVKLGKKDRAGEMFSRACKLGSDAGCSHARNLGSK